MTRTVTEPNRWPLVAAPHVSAFAEKASEDMGQVAQQGGPVRPQEWWEQW